MKQSNRTLFRKYKNLEQRFKRTKLQASMVGPAQLEEEDEDDEEEEEEEEEDFKKHQQGRVDTALMLSISGAVLLDVLKR